MLTSKLYTGNNDLEAMIDLLKRARPADRIADYPGLFDLQELMPQKEIYENTRLWVDGNGRLHAFAIVYTTYRNLYFEIAPEAKSDAIEQAIIDWGVACVKRAYPNADQPLTLDANGRDDDPGKLALLQRHGFIPNGVCSLTLHRPLDIPIPVPQLPDGFVIRPVAGEEEAEALVALHRAAFNTDNMNLEDRLASMRTPEYKRELDLVAVAPDGRLAAFCVGSISEGENERSGWRDGYTDPVGTHPDFQRRGLAQALLLTGMQLLKEQGMETAVLGTSSENSAMQKTAKSVGFNLRWTKIWFAKPI